MPYQVIVTVGDLLIAARGPHLDLINLSSTTLIFSWKPPPASSKQNQPELCTETTIEQRPEISNDTAEPENSPPVKKIKLTQSKTSEVDASFKSKKSESDHPKNENIPSSIDSPNISLLKITKDGKHIVLVTREDKSIRVLEIIGTGQSRKINQLSQRLMPKRPCALALTDDDTFKIIIADKFGDVYSLPLLEPSHDGFSKSPVQNTVPKLSHFTPVANELTVHSKRNKKALESQRKQKYQNSQKSQMNFSCELLLGHVSMLTDVKLAMVDGYGYIITSDRDEHIRVSRGIPQTYIIENYCLGHSEFVSRLCIPETKQSILISGGGDDDLFIWDWRRGSLLSKVGLKDHIAAVRSKLFGEIDQNETLNSRIKVAVSEILHVDLTVDCQVVNLFVISCESLPALFTFTLSPENKLEYAETVWTSGNVLSLSVTSDHSLKSKSLLVSIDNIHKPGSSIDIREEDTSNMMPLCRFDFDGVTLKRIPLVIEIPVDKSFKDMHRTSAEISDLYYGIEILRKRCDEVQI
ncbi:tRNA -methyltransferase non-catalytic subunit trm82 [Erysiphe neolycopersici]|uniref:tRNA-methyltransferase non-catalytic subunit trm82 n=1 Tax=Erysiphe neolycopersici TaxID=212602 RepID=A0A420I7Z0_9PEZI|nr:tRNA -methyltransferase non-catalytic subunit trm82 [Erysiphe neolycopersici]